MKKIGIILFILINTCFFAQTPPNYINYQGVARNNSGDPITAVIGIQFKIHTTSGNGPVIYTETNVVTPNTFGVFNLRIGENNQTAFALINWGAADHFLEVSMDATGNTNYQPVGTQQMVSVPYALYAKTAGNSVSYNPGTNISFTGPVNSPTINSNPALSLAGNLLSISGSGSPVTLPTSSLTASSNVTVTSTGVNSFNINVPNYVAGNNVTITAPTSGNDYTINAASSSTATSPWTNTGTNVFLLTPSDNVSIGGVSSTAKLTVTTSVANDAILAQSQGANGILAMTASSGTANAGVYGTNNASGYGVKGETISSNTLVAGVYGSNTGSGSGVQGITTAVTSGAAGVKGTNASGGAGVYGENIYVVGSVGAHGVKGVTGNPGAQATGVTGINTNFGAGVYGEHTGASNSGNAHGVSGKTNGTTVSAYGVLGESTGLGSGVYGTTSSSAINAAGVVGKNTGTTGSGVIGESSATAGNAAAVFGNNLAGTPGIVGQNNAASNSPLAMGVRGLSNSTNSTAIAISGESTGAAMGMRAAIPSGTVAGSSNVALLFDNGHIRSTQFTAATVATFSVSGGPMSLTYTTTNCTDSKGSILAVCTTSGMINPGGQATMRISFFKPYITIPTVVITPTSDYGQLNFFISNISQTGFNLTVKNSTSLSISGTTAVFSFNYFVIE